MAEVIAWSYPKGELRLSDNELHVWLARLDLDSTPPDGLAVCLSSEEKARAARFALARDRGRFIVSRRILRQLLGAYLCQSPASVAIEVGRYGKPALDPRTNTNRLCFNLSHSHGLVLFAFALGREVGIDLERMRPEIANEGIERNYFSKQELSELDALPAELRPEGFFLCWTRKEAYVKGRGEGLQVSLRSFDVSLTPGLPAALRAVDGPRWSLHSFCPEPEFVAACVVEGQGVHPQFWEWRELAPDA